ncbi:MAG: FAD-dependent oxidoreductase [Acidobacteriota bacterium]
MSEAPHLADAVEKTASRTVIIGAGVAGLSCAIELLSAGRRVTVIERAAEPGGRARSFLWREAGVEVDTGAHLVLGCYEHFRWLADAVRRRAVNCRMTVLPRMRVDLRSLAGERVVIRGGGGGRLWSLVSLMLSSGLGLRNRLAILGAMRQVDLLKNTTYVEEWLGVTAQPPGARRWFWNPMVKAVANQETWAAPSRHFHLVLQRAFLGAEADPRMVIVEGGLSAVYARPAMEVIGELGGRIVLGDGVASLELDGRRVVAVVTGKGNRLEADHAVSCIPPDALRKLLPGEELERFEPSPIVSAHALLRKPIRPEGAPVSMVGMVDAPFQWAFQSRINRGWHVSLLTSAAEALVARSTRQLEETARDVLKSFFTLTDADILAVLPVKDRYATYRTQDAAPWSGMENSPENLLIAGDWTEPDYPCTLESAALSGRRAAKRILEPEGGPGE